MTLIKSRDDVELALSQNCSDIVFSPTLVGYKTTPPILDDNLLSLLKEPIQKNLMKYVNEEVQGNDSEKVRIIYGSVEYQVRYAVTSIGRVVIASVIPASLLDK